MALSEKVIVPPEKGTAPSEKQTPPSEKGIRPAEKGIIPSEKKIFATGPPNRTTFFRAQKGASAGATQRPVEQLIAWLRGRRSVKQCQSKH